MPSYLSCVFLCVGACTRTSNTCLVESIVNTCNPFGEQPWVRQQQQQIIQIKQLVWQHWFINYSHAVCCCCVQCIREYLNLQCLAFCVWSSVCVTCFQLVKYPRRYLFKYNWIHLSCMCSFIMSCTESLCFCFKFDTSIEILHWSFECE